MDNFLKILKIAGIVLGVFVVIAVIGYAKKLMIKFGLVKDPAQLDEDGNPAPPPPPAPLPNSGSGIPQGWSPEPAARKIHNALRGITEDEEAVYAAFSGLTQDQKVAVINEFNRLFFGYYRTDFWGVVTTWFSPSELEHLNQILQL